VASLDELKTLLEGALKRVDTLEAEVTSLRAENSKLRERVSELENELGEEQRKGKRQAAPFRRRQRKPKNEHKPSGRKAGHDPARKMEPPKVDNTVHTPLGSCCPGCGGCLSDRSEHIHHVIDIPPVVPVVTRHITESATCLGCGQRWNSQPAELPSFAAGAAGVMFGHRAAALATQLRTQLGAPLRKIAAYFTQVFGLPISHGGILGLLKRVNNALEPTQTHLVEQLRTASRVCADETGWRMANESAWAWVFTNSDTTCYVVDKGRGHGVVLSLLGPDFDGVLQSDCFLAYLPLPYKKAKCLAHILKALKELEALQSGDDAEFSKDSIALLKQAIGLERQREKTPPEIYRILCRHLEKRLDQLLAREFTDSKNLKLAKRLRRYRNEWLVFLYNEDVEPTNNLAERQIRPFVLQRKISAGNRSEWGAALHARIMSVFSTAAQRGVNFVDLLVRALTEPQLAHL